MRLSLRALLFLSLSFATPLWAQEVVLEWQQTGLDKAGIGNEFSHLALRADFQAILANYERRRYAEAVSQNGTRSFTRTSLGAQYLFELNDRYALWPRLKVHSGYSNHMSSRSFTYNPQLVSIYQSSDQFAFVAGFGALMHTTENQYYPVLGIAFLADGTSRWSGNLTVPEGLIAYQLSDKLSAQLGLKWQTRYYEINHSQPSYIKTQDILISAGYRYQLLEQLDFKLRATYATARKIRYFDNDAAFMHQLNLASTFGMHASFSFSF